MNSKILAVIVPVLTALSVATAPMAQINLDTTYSATGARPFDEPIDPDHYLIRPGEKLEVVFLRAKLSKLKLEVNAEGRLVHAELGLFDLAGRTLSQVRTILLEPLQRLYRADEIVISVNSIYPVAIQVSGMVNRPGTYVGYTSQRVNEIIDSAGGVTENGSTRNITFSGGPLDIPVDLDLYKYGSDRSQNPCLYSGYRVIVPPKSTDQVQIIGAVLEPRAVELIFGETVGDLIRLAGGLVADTDRAEIHILPDRSRSVQNSSPLNAGNIVVVSELDPYGEAETLKLFGFVSRPGLYSYSANLSITELLSEAGGVRPEANTDRITIFRKPEKDAMGKRPVGRYPMILGDTESVILRPADSVFVPRLVGYVSISGLVNRSGFVPYTAGNTVGDYVRLVGGAADLENKPIVEVSNRISGLTQTATMRTVVYDGDVITVRRGDEN